MLVVMKILQKVHAGTSSQDSTRTDMSDSFVSPVTRRRRKNRTELQEARQHMKDAISSLNKVLQKQEVPHDDCDKYRKILAKVENTE